MNVKTTRETLQINEQKGKIIFHSVAAPMDTRQNIGDDISGEAHVHQKTSQRVELFYLKL